MIKHALKVRPHRNLMSSSSEDEKETKILKKRSRDEV